MTPEYPPLTLTSMLAQLEVSVPSENPLAQLEVSVIHPTSSLRVPQITDWTVSFVRAESDQ